LFVFAEGPVLVEAISESSEEVTPNVDDHTCVIEASNEAFEHGFGAGASPYAGVGVSDPLGGFVLCQENFELV
jgi:hypothetical protein